GTVLILFRDHREVQVVTPSTLSVFRGPALILPGVSFLSDSERSQLASFAASGGRLIITGPDNTHLPDSSRVTRLAASPGAALLANLEKDFIGTFRSANTELTALLPSSSRIVVEASPFVVSHIALVDGKSHVFLINFSGIVPHRNLKPTPEASACVSVSAGTKATLSFAPFLGEEQKLTGKRLGDKVKFCLPTFHRGAVVWLNESK